MGRRKNGHLCFVRAIVVDDPKIHDIDQLQKCFAGGLNLAKRQDGMIAIYPEPKEEKSFFDFAARSRLELQSLYV